MLRALAGYLLGGILNDSPQETIECETREVNDWLVVNMPNKPDESDIDFISERESDIEDQEVLEDHNIDFDSSAASEIDEDEILTCLPMLMTYDELEYQESFFGGKTPIEETSLVVLQNPDQIQRIQVDDRFPSQGKFHNKPNSNARPSPKLNKSYFKQFESSFENSECHKMIQSRKFFVKSPGIPNVESLNPVQNIPPSIHQSSNRNMEAQKTDIVQSWNEGVDPRHEKYLEIEYIKSIWPENVRFPAKIDFSKSRFSKPDIAFLLACDRHMSDATFLEIIGDIRMSRHIQMPTYINHRPSSSVINKEDLKKHLQEQIKELRPTQQAKALSLKKQNSRSQLKRHNQNYIYCTSAKASRRKDLQRNHSGANNNRKC